MTKKLALETRANDDHHVIQVKGDVDLDSSPELHKALRQAMKGARCLKLDLKHVGYLDSSGIAVLVQGYKWARKKSVDYRLLDPSPQVRAVIELSQLDKLFTIETSGVTA